MKKRTWLILGGFLLLAVCLIILFQTRSLVKTRKLLKEKERELENTEKRKDELEFRDKNMTDSLVYAQRIQEALLPSEDYFRTHFRESFIFFRPKDIVSGDFYWIGEKDDRIFIAGADCTGHGVPGAFMSMLGVSLLNEIILNKKITQPGLVLNILRENIIQSLKQVVQTSGVKDGMDMCVCLIDFNNNKMQFAGANNPLWMFVNGQLNEIKGDKMPVAIHDNMPPFTNHTVDLKKGDTFYIFSDGYADQFGGEENKKFMFRRFRYLLLTINRFPLEDQKSILEENIRSWQGSNAQVDDILIIGFKPL